MMPPTEWFFRDAGDVLRALRDEIERALVTHGLFNSTHEALGVLSEEWDELRDAMHENNLDGMLAEALQVAATAYRLAQQLQEAKEGRAPEFARRSGIASSKRT